MGTVASMRGYASEPLFWSVGMGLAAFVGYLRIAADKHYFTDVLVGALVGTVSGIVVPRLLHPSAETTRAAATAFGRSEPPGAPQPLQLSYSGHF